MKSWRQNTKQDLAIEKSPPSSSQLSPSWRTVLIRDRVESGARREPRNSSPGGIAVRWEPPHSCGEERFSAPKRRCY